jgi:hypothetical protein
MLLQFFRGPRPNAVEAVVPTIPASIIRQWCWRNFFDALG